MVLDVIEAHQNKSLQHGHHIFEVCRVIVQCADKVRSINDWEDVNRNFTLGVQRNGRAVSMDDFNPKKVIRLFRATC